MKVIPWLWELSYWSCRATLLVRGRMKLRFHGPVPKGPVVLCSKHATSLDIPITSYLCRAYRGDRPFFQMGSFIGYRVLGPLTFILRRIGAFSVMRPKETRRLIELRGMERRAALEHMREVNEQAEAIRRKVLSEGGCLIVFPEGTRNESEVLPLRSRLEIGSAVAVVEPPIEIPVSVWPIVLSFGKKRFFRRTVVIDALESFPIQGSVESVVAQIETLYQHWWLPTDQAEAAYRATDPDTLSP